MYLTNIDRPVLGPHVQPGGQVLYRTDTDWWQPTFSRLPKRHTGLLVTLIVLGCVCPPLWVGALVGMLSKDTTTHMTNQWIWRGRVDS